MRARPCRPILIHAVIATTSSKPAVPGHTTNRKRKKSNTKISLMHLQVLFTVSEHSSIALSVTRGRNMISLSMKNLSAVSMRSGWPVFQERQRWSAINARAPSIWSFLRESVKCPRCKKGTFETFNPSQEMEKVTFPVPPPNSPLRVRQRGGAIRVPKPTVVIDSAEHMGYTFERFANWFSGTVRKRLAVGDYTLLGMEEEVIVERKTVPDLVKSMIQERNDFIKKCERLSAFKKSCLVVEGSLSDVKTPYEDSQSHPNAVLGSLLAAQERWNIPVYFLDNFLLPKNLLQAC